MADLYRVTERRGTKNYQVRFYVPAEYREAVGRKEIWRSLGTPDRRVARELAPRVADDILTELKAANALHTPKVLASLKEPTREQIDRAARYVYACEVQSDQDELMDVSLNKIAQRGSPKSALDNRRYSEEIRQAALRGDFSRTMEDHWREEFGFTFKPGSPKEDDFRQRLAWAYAEAAQRWAEHDEGDFGKEASNPLFKGIAIAAASDSKFPDHPAETGMPAETISAPVTPLGAPPSSTGTQPSLMDLWPAYERQKCGSVRPSTKEDKRRMVQLFAEFTGPARPADSITKADAREWRDALFEMPISASQRKEFRGKSMREIIEINKQIGRRTLSKESINKHLSMVGAFFQWMVAEGRVSQNVMDGLRIETLRKGSKRATFTVEQLQKLFDAPWFTGCAADKDIITRMTPGPVKIRDWRYWVPLLAAFTGARQGELLQLEASDIRRDDGIDYILITDEGDTTGKAIKSANAKRSVPVHSQLIELGFLEYVSKQKQAGHVRIFPELKRNSRGYFNYAQKELAKLIEHMNFPPDKNGNKVVFHSFRHAAADEFRRRYIDEQFKPLLGHKQSGVTRGYGVAEDLGLARRQEIIEEIRYPGLDLSKLKL